MMREKVCIVLNEREPNKARAAEILQQQLHEQGVQALRVEIDEHIEEVIKLRNPQVLVLDYLIGDYTTGLDILAGLRQKSGGPHVIFLTDEPSVPVAVEAMRLGASDYFELDHPLSINNTCRSIARLLQQQKKTAAPESSRMPQLGELVGHSPAFKQALQRAQSLATISAPVIILWGPAGSGLTTIAQALHHAKGNPSYLKYYDPDICTESPAQFLGLNDNPEEALCLGHNMSVLVESAEGDEGEFLDVISEAYGRCGHREPRNLRSYVYACCNREKTAAAWQRLTGADIFRMPSLSQRTEDIPALIQRFVLRTAQSAGETIKPFPADVMEWSTGLPWPGELKQLSAVIADAAVSTLHRHASVTELIQDARERWEADRSLQPAPGLITPAAVLQALETCNYRHRPAAAMLGCSLSALRRATAAGLGITEKTSS